MILTTIVRAIITGVEATLGILIAAGFTDLDATGYQAAAVVGLTAAASVVYNTLKAWLAAQPSIDIPESSVL